MIIPINKNIFNKKHSSFIYFAKLSLVNKRIKIIMCNKSKANETQTINEIPRQAVKFLSLKGQFIIFEKILTKKSP